MSGVRLWAGHPPSSRAPEPETPDIRINLRHRQRGTGRKAPVYTDGPTYTRPRPSVSGEPRPLGERTCDPSWICNRPRRSARPLIPTCNRRVSRETPMSCPPRVEGLLVIAPFKPRVRVVCPTVPHVADSGRPDWTDGEGRTCLWSATPSSIRT